MLLIGRLEHTDCLLILTKPDVEGSEIQRGHSVLLRFTRQQLNALSPIAAQSASPPGGFKRITLLRARAAQQ